MSTHTPGPWRVLIEGLHCFIEDPHGNTIARPSHPFPFTTTDDERNANARLIAAAPDLLAVLCEAVESPLRTEGSDWWVRVNAAIAKATGSSGSQATAQA